MSLNARFLRGCVGSFSVALLLVTLSAGVWAACHDSEVDPHVDVGGGYKLVQYRRGLDVRVALVRWWVEFGRWEGSGELFWFDDRGGPEALMELPSSPVSMNPPSVNLVAVAGVSVAIVAACFARTRATGRGFTVAAVGERHNQPWQRTEAAGTLSAVRKESGRGPGH